MAWAPLLAHAHLFCRATPPAHFAFSALPVTARPASERDGSDLLPERLALLQKQQVQKQLEQPGPRP